MAMSKSTLMLERMMERELDVCLWFNRACRYPGIRDGFAFISWLGDGKFWYALILSLPLAFGETGLMVALKMTVVGLLAVAIYKLIKSRTVRPRPYAVNHAIYLGTAALDRYSFPSGHTMHAAAFTLMACHYFPALAWVLIPFAVLVALSRVILGLHYPTDVFVGAVIGMGLAFTSLYF
jgi:undecaprenyl-diphosphatase